MFVLVVHSCKHGCRGGYLVTIYSLLIKQRPSAENIVGIQELQLTSLIFHYTREPLGGNVAALEMFYDLS